ncbi:Arc family DNA-binding protein [Pseudomonas edaphica]|uniref:Arc family DNA-binding protein n=2 Tax=Pseudomonas edaphica TaxID=2006980 RepID=A0ABY2UER1_9PSED|nr:Arc family DNA-binding protein [Pseudomonas edaphica]TLG93144.1 Arc family DNA-binding protein [Pseudomonas edaphica]
MRQEKVPLVIRLPLQLRDWLSAKSEENGRTANGEVVFRLRKMMEQELVHEKQQA